MLNYCSEIKSTILILNPKVQVEGKEKEYGEGIKDNMDK